MHSVLIENGRVFDSNRNAFTESSIILNGDRIETVDSHISSNEAAVKIDAANLFVTAGFIDFHGHFFEKGTDIGVDPDLASLPFGITTVGDAGSTGISNFESFLSLVVKPSRVTMRCFLNVSPSGLITTQFHENVNPAVIDEDKISLLYRTHKEIILGLKLRMSKEVVLDHGMKPLIKIRSIADKLRCRLNIHVTNPAGSIADILQYLKSGDIFTHVFHGKGKTIIDKGEVLPEIINARKCGVFFDASNGANHFSFDVAQKAIKCGFLPDIISTDITKNTLMKPPVFSLIHVLSKYLNMGVNLENIIPACTKKPAKIMGLDATIGDISPGKKADITLFDIVDQNTQFTDFANKAVIGEKYIEPVITIKNGVILYLNHRYVNIVSKHY